MTTTQLGQSKTPDNTRLFAIGDVHGCLEELKALHQLIMNDLAANPVKNYKIIHLGDYVDRGPQSCGCIQFLLDMTRENQNVLCFKGNHEDKFLKFLREPIETVDSFLTYGGEECAISYGVKPPDNALSDEQTISFCEEMRKAIPIEHTDFLENLPTSYIAGDYMFVHAGIRPGVPLDAQDDYDLMWIRKDFLPHKEPFEKVIIHGHTPHHHVRVETNRINIDTMAFSTGKLTCLVLEADQYRFLETGKS